MIEATSACVPARKRTGFVRTAEREKVAASPRRLSEAHWAIETVLWAALGPPDGGSRGGLAGGRRAVLIRQVAMYLMHVGCGVPMERVGDAFGRDRSTVGHACRAIEDRRDDAGFDRLLDCLERAAMALAEALETRRIHDGRLP